MRGGRRLASSLLVAAFLLAACDGAAFVDRLVVVNDTSYDSHVEVRGGSGGWLGVTMVPAGSTREVQDVIDQGATWIFRFSYAAYEPVEVEIARSELVDAGWRVEVPEELEQDLRGEGVPPPP